MPNSIDTSRKGEGAMPNKGFLEVGLNENHEVIVNHPRLETDENGVGHIVFSAQQARNFAGLLLKHADDSEAALRSIEIEKRSAAAAAIPVDRSARTLTDGSPVTDDHREIISGGVRAGQQKGYVVLSNAERAKGFVRPYRNSYIHKPCGSLTTMGRTIAETYARDPGFYSGTFCCGCGHHFPLEQFVWDGTDQQVGS